MSVIASSATATGMSAGASSHAASVRRIRKNTISNAAGICVHILLQLGLMFLMFEVLSTAAYAAYIAATAVIAVCEMASDFGARLWATRQFAITSQPRTTLQLAWSCKLFYTLASGLVLVFVPLNTLSLS